jgi:hypothetical protein
MFFIAHTPLDMTLAHIRPAALFYLENKIQFYLFFQSEKFNPTSFLTACTLPTTARLPPPASSSSAGSSTPPGTHHSSQIRRQSKSFSDRFGIKELLFLLVVL